MEKRIEQLEKDMKYLINRVKELNSEIQTLKENESINHSSTEMKKLLSILRNE